MKVKDFVDIIANYKLHITFENGLTPLYSGVVATAPLSDELAELEVVCVHPLHNCIGLEVKPMYKGVE